MALHMTARVASAAILSLLAKLGLSNGLRNGLIIAIGCKHALVTRLEKLLRRHHHLVVARRTIRSLALVDQVEEMCLVSSVGLPADTRGSPNPVVADGRVLD